MAWKILVFCYIFFTVSRSADFFKYVVVYDGDCCVTKLRYFDAWQVKIDRKRYFLIFIMLQALSLLKFLFAVCMIVNIFGR